MIDRARGRGDAGVVRRRQGEQRARIDGEGRGFRFCVLPLRKQTAPPLGGSAALIVTTHCRVLFARDWSLLAKADVRDGRIKCRNSTSGVASRSCPQTRARRAASALVHNTVAKGQKLAGAAPSIDMRLSISHPLSYPQPDVISDRLLVRRPSVHAQFDWAFALCSCC